MTSQCLTYLGDDSRGGTYVLRIHVERPVKMAFGRFDDGRLFDVPRGDHAYIGSALADRGATCLARRLVRHACRCGRRPAHDIRHLMLDEFPRVALGDGSLLPANGKHLRWNVDYLLNKPFAHLVAAYVIRHPHRIERKVGQQIQSDPAAVIYAPGLGANDINGNTHLLLIDDGDDWWRRLPDRLAEILPASARPTRTRR